jgi:hypothetical protein
MSSAGSVPKCDWECHALRVSCWILQLRHFEPSQSTDAEQVPGIRRTRGAADCDREDAPQNRENDRDGLAWGVLRPARSQSDPRDIDSRACHAPGR